MIEQISVKDLKRAHDGGTPRVIDVREKHEYDGGHIPGAEWIPMSLVPLRAEEFKSADQVKDKKGIYTAIVGGLIVVAFVAPMVQFWFYTGGD